MRVLQINSFGNLSTGRIAVDLYRTLLSSGQEGCVAYARGKIPPDVTSIRIGTDSNIKRHALASRITDKTGFYSAGVTKRLIAQIETFQPDIIHLHNLHGYYLNLSLLLTYLKQANLPVVWTLHDCWAFTGHCAYFDVAHCEKWKTGCSRCPQKNSYPSSLLLDNSAWNYEKKKDLFTSLQNMVIATPSHWLKALVQQSFLKDYEVKVIPNGIDLHVFQPTSGNFRERYGLQNKRIVLGVASTWDKRKGLIDFVSLSKMLGEDYQIVVVGVSHKEKAHLPETVTGITRTGEVQELAAIYTAADVYVNATYEDNFPTTNLEALACGTPVITYATGGSPESVTKDCGFVVKTGDLDALAESIRKIPNRFSKGSCLAQAQKYNRDDRFAEYLALYQDLLQNSSFPADLAPNA